MRVLFGWLAADNKYRKLCGPSRVLLPELLEMFCFLLEEVCNAIYGGCKLLLPAYMCVLREYTRLSCGLQV